MIILNSYHLKKFITKRLIIPTPYSLPLPSPSCTGCGSGLRITGGIGLGLNTNNNKNIINFHTSTILYSPEEPGKNNSIKEDSLNKNSNLNASNSIEAGMENNGFVSNTVNLEEVSLEEVSLEEVSLEHIEKILIEEQNTLLNNRYPLTDNQKLNLYEEYNTKLKLGLKLTAKESELLHKIYDDFQYEGIFQKKLSTPQYKFYLKKEPLYTEVSDLNTPTNTCSKRLSTIREEENVKDSDSDNSTPSSPVSPPSSSPSPPTPPQPSPSLPGPNSAREGRQEADNGTGTTNLNSINSSKMPDDSEDSDNFFSSINSSQGLYYFLELIFIFLNVFINKCILLIFNLII